MTFDEVKGVLARIDQRSGPWSSCSLHLREFEGDRAGLVLKFAAVERNCPEWRRNDDDTYDSTYELLLDVRTLDDLDEGKVVDWAFEVIRFAAVHELAENFYFDDVRVRDPHKELASRAA